MVDYDYYINTYLAALSRQMIFAVWPLERARICKPSAVRQSI